MHADILSRRTGQSFQHMGEFSHIVVPDLRKSMVTTPRISANSKQLFRRLELLLAVTHHSKQALYANRRAQLSVQGCDWLASALLSCRTIFGGLLRAPTRCYLAV